MGDKSYAVRAALGSYRDRLLTQGLSPENRRTFMLVEEGLTAYSAIIQASGHSDPPNMARLQDWANEWARICPDDLLDYWGFTPVSA